MKTLGILLAALLLLSAGTMSAAEINASSFLKFTPTASGSKLPKTLSTSAREFSVNVPAFTKAFTPGQQSIIINDFPVSNTSVGSLLLTPVHSVVDENTEWFKGSMRVPAPNVVAYRGTIVGEPGSKVILNYASGDMIGCVIHSSGEKFVISPYSSSVAANRDHVIGEESALRTENKTPGFSCATPEMGLPIPSVEELRAEYGDQRALSDRLLEIEVIVEATDEFYKLRNDYDKSAEYVVSLFNMVSMVYEDEVNITFKIVEAQIYTTEEPDPYANSGGENDKLLRDVVAKWQTRSKARDLVCVLSDGGTTKVLGISNGIGGMCNNTDGALSGYVVCGITSYMVLPTLAYSDEASTIAHEIGHNIAAYHTHNCWWKPALDSCTSSGVASTSIFYSDACNKGNPIYNTGSIMSYCHLWNRGIPFTFLTRVSDVLRAAADKKACLTEPSTAMIKVDYPFANHQFKAGSTEEIRWTSTKVTSVKIEYSLDNGKTWTIVPGAENIDAKTGGRPFGNAKITWVVPSANTTQGLIRITDASNPSLTSLSLSTFTIQAVSLVLQSPAGGEKFGQKEKFDVQWTSSLVSRVKVEFSSNGGGEWTTLSASQSGSSYSFDVPDIETSQAIIKISDASNNALVAQSGVFSIGKEKIMVFTPNGGDIVCSGKDFEVRWGTDFIGSSSSRIRIEYSADNGKVWNNVTSTVGIDARLGKYTWSATNKIASAGKALVRISYKLDTSVAAVSASNFTIDAGAACTPVGVSEANPYVGMLTVSPNPISSQGVATIEFPAPCASIECLLVDTKGATVAQFGTYDNMSAGAHEIRFDVSGIPSGAYFLTLRCGGQRISAPVTILR
ncbi:MAG: M12 family metallo-peptidase [Candidatus Kapaibacterium sp.]